MSHYDEIERTQKQQMKKRSPAGYRKPIYSGFFFKGGLASIL